MIKLNSYYANFLVCIFLFISNCLFGQDGVFSGKITDANSLPLQSANVLLMATDKSVAPSFGTTNENGNYIIKITQNKTYKLTITFIGFTTINKDITFIKETTKLDFTLQESPNELEEVVLNYKPNIEIKKDTTTYNVDGFTNGKERKLKEVLKKLPGVEVDRKGNVFIKDKKVTKVLIEGKTFFNGRTKLAVENIPADVVSEIQMIEDYHETAFLKGFKDSGEIVMNIKLKENKKNFIFGDIETGLGLEDKYRLHPSIFKYNPKMLFNIIGDVNNTYSKSFTLADYMAFEGDKSPEKMLSAFNSNIGKFLQNKDYYKNKHLFGGFNGQLNPNDKNEIRLFVLGLRDKSYSKNLDSYIYPANQAFENRTKDVFKNNSIFLGKFQYKYKPDNNTVLKFETSVENNNLQGNNGNTTSIATGTTAFDNNTEADGKTVSAVFKIDKWFSDNNATTLNFSYSNKSNNQIQQWNSAENFFSAEIPITNDTFYSVLGLDNIKSNNYNLDLQHFYRPTRIDLLTIGLKGQLNRSSLEATNQQRTTANERVNFNGYGNDIDNNFESLDLSLSYKRYVGDLSLSAGLTYNITSWKDNYDGASPSVTKNNILPSVLLEWEFDEKKKLKLAYNKNRQAPTLENRLPNRKILDFNRVFEGNPFLEMDNTERILLSFSSFKSYGLSIYGKLGYRKIDRGIINTNTFQQIYSISSPVQLKKPSKGYDASLRLKYNRKYWKISLTNEYYNRSTPIILNGLEFDSRSSTTGNYFDFQTNFEEFPNIDLEIRNSYNINKASLFENKTNSTVIDLAMEYDFKDWKFRYSFEQNYYKNISQNNSSSFGRITGAVFYHKEDSSWEFGIDFYNLGGNKEQISNSFSIDRFHESSISVFPRTIMFNVYYKL